MTVIENSIDLTPIKRRQQETWALGDYSVVGTTLQIVGETLCETLDLRAGARVLDVCAGNGNASLAAARRFCDVTSTDYVPSLLEAGRRRAVADGLSIRFVSADVEQLPFGDDAYDYVLSTFGVMFAPDQRRAASELLRVCRPGGQIGVASWTPDSFVGELFRVVGRHAPPPQGVPSPADWGTMARASELFAAARFVSGRERTFTFRYVSAEHFVDVFRTFYGPVHRAYASVSTAGESALTADLVSLAERRNRARDGSLVIASEYLEVVAQKG